MNTKKTTLNGKEIEMRFGSWSIIELEKSGIKLSDIEKYLSENPFAAITKIAYLSACNAAGCDLSAYREAEFYDWLDEYGIHSPEVKKILDLFVDWATRHSEQVKPTKKKPV